MTIILDKKKIKDPETMHSDFIAWAMDPLGSHGLRDIFIKKIIERSIPELSDLLKEDLSDVSVYRESFNIDIMLVSFKHKFTIIIENKTLSDEISGQLKRYEDSINNYYLGFNNYCLYLTLNGDKATRSGWRTASYIDIIEIIGVILDAGIDEDVEKVLTEYIGIVKGNGSLKDLFKNKIFLGEFGFIDNTKSEEKLIERSVYEMLYEFDESGWIRTPFIKEGTHICFTTQNIYDICRKIGVPYLMYYDLRLGENGTPWVTLYFDGDRKSNFDIRKEWFDHLRDIEYYNNPRCEYAEKKYIFSKWVCSLRSHDERRRDEIVDNLRFFFEVHLERIDNIIEGIYRRINGLDESIDTKISAERVISKMKELSEVIEYEFNDITNLEKAFYARKMTKDECGVNSENYCNSSMATLGDSVLKLLITDHLYENGMTMGDITKNKSVMEDNRTFSEVSRELGLEHFAFNEEFFFDDAPPEKRLPDSSHNLYLEALACAIYKDSGLEGCRDWFERVLLERLFWHIND